jgi:predicted DNA-binding protein (MmcQ/YjbR family)
MAARDPLPRLRKICLAFPEATEKEAWGEPTFRVGGKLFAMYDNHHHAARHIAVWCKAPPGAQEILVSADSEKFFVPPYVGHKGWIGIRLDRTVDWDEVAEILEDSYRMTAPKRLCATLPPRHAEGE